MVKKAAKKAFSKGSKADVLTLKAILEMTYVNEVMAKSDVNKIKKAYESAPEEAKTTLCAKLLRIQSIYDKFAAEKDPKKRKALMLKAIKDGVVKLEEKAKEVKKMTLRKLEEAEHSHEVAMVEDKLSKI